MFTNYIYSIFTYKEILALNGPKELICYKSQLNQILLWVEYYHHCLIRKALISNYPQTLICHKTKEPN